jgi:hypothetical protein
VDRRRQHNHGHEPERHPLRHRRPTAIEAPCGAACHRKTGGFKGEMGTVGALPST